MTNSGYEFNTVNVSLGEDLRKCKVTQMPLGLGRIEGKLMALLGPPSDLQSITVPARPHGIFSPQAKEFSGGYAHFSDKRGELSLLEVMSRPQQGELGKLVRVLPASDKLKLLYLSKRPQDLLWRSQCSVHLPWTGLFASGNNCEVAVVQKSDGRILNVYRLQKQGNNIAIDSPASINPPPSNRTVYVRCYYCYLGNDPSCWNLCDELMPTDAGVGTIVSAGSEMLPLTYPQGQRNSMRFRYADASMSSDGNVTALQPAVARPKNPQVIGIVLGLALNVEQCGSAAYIFQEQPKQGLGFGRFIYIHLPLTDPVLFRIRNMTGNKEISAKILADGSCGIKIVPTG